MRNRLIKLLYLCLSVFICGSTLADTTEPKFRHQTIDDKIQIGYGVAVADVDGDKKPDILLADKKQFVWYRNPTWEKFVIAENLTARDNVCLAAQDLDGDGKCELAVGADWDPNDHENSGAVFYLIAPADRTQRWEAVKLHAEPTVHRMRWIKLSEGGWGLVVAPLNGRGKDGAAGSKILLYHNPGDPHAEWKTEALDDSMHATHNFEITGPSSLFIAGKEGVFDVRLQRGGENQSKAKDQLEGSKSAGEVRAGKLRNAHFVTTVEPMHGNRLVVYATNTLPCTSGSPDRVVLTDKLAEGHALACGDVLKTGGDQIVVGWRGGKGGVHLWSAVHTWGDNWTDTAIDDGGMACEDLCLADLNGDGRLDVIASGRATHNAKIYWNEGNASIAPTKDTSHP
jgi:hypothetical protein